MFLWTESTDNILRYRLSPWEKLDKLTVSVLNQGGDIPMVPVGIVEEEGNTDILLPVSGYITLERAVTEINNAEEILLLLERAAHIYNEAEKRMIPVSEILFLPDTILIDKETGNLKLLCIPVFSKYGRRHTVKRTFLSLTASALTHNIEKGEYLLLFLKGLNKYPEKEAIPFLFSFNRKVLSEKRLKTEEKSEPKKKEKRSLFYSLKEKMEGTGSESELIEFLESPGMNFEQWLEDN